MKRILSTLLFVFVVVTFSCGQSSHKRLPASSSIMKFPSVYPINVGVKGCVVDNAMAYSALNTGKTRHLLSLDGGIAFEWRSLENVSLGLDVMYSSRGAKKSFKTEYLLDYLTSDFAYYDYCSRIRGVEVFLPITGYLEIHFPEDLTFLRNSMSKLYLFVGPELYVPISGKMDWKRYYSDGIVYREYHVDATKATIRDYYYGIGFGIGFWHKDYHSFSKRSINTFTISKVDFSCFLESNTFSKLEMEETVEHVYAWGDLEHETLGRRYGLVCKITGTVLFPVKNMPSNSCYGVGAKGKKRSGGSK